MPSLFSRKRYFIASLLVLIQIVLIAGYLSYRFDFSSLTADVLQSNHIPTQERHMVIYSQENIDNPYLNQSELRPFYSLVYSTLVRQEDGTIMPDLASSFGLLRQEDDASVWQLRLRPGVTFHDGSSLDFEDIVSSFERSMNPDLQSSTLQNFNEEENTFEIVTRDSELLATLSTLYITPSKSAMGVGTGPFSFLNSRSEPGSSSEIRLIPFAHYYGDQPNVTYVVSLLTSPFRSVSRSIQYLREKDSLEIYNIPGEYIDPFRPYCQLDASQNLQPYFLLRNVSNLDNDIYTIVRNAVLLGRDRLLESYPGSVLLSQFASPGMEGYDPLAVLTPAEPQTLDIPERITLYTSFRDVALAANLAHMVQPYGVVFDLVAVSDEVLLEKMSASEGDMYLTRVDFQSTPTALKFYRQFVARDGVYNTGYLNTRVEQLLDQLTDDNRSETLLDISRILGSAPGVPLFDTAFVNGVCTRN